MASTIVVPTENVLTEKQVKDAFTAASTDIGDLQSFATGLTANKGTATATAGAATLNKVAGVITSESLTTAAGADYTLTITNSSVAATSIVMASVANGTNTTDGPCIKTVAPGAGSLVIKVTNSHASSALNGTVKVAFAVVG